MRIRREFRFEASHQLPRHPGVCSRLHGHSYRMTVEVEGPVDPETGMVLDFDELDRLVRGEVLFQIDHRHWNDVLENPTAEGIALWLWRRLRPHLPGLVRLELVEMDGASVVYQGEHEEGA